jgi:hypothetical protein
MDAYYDDPSRLATASQFETVASTGFPWNPRNASAEIGPTEILVPSFDGRIDQRAGARLAPSVSYPMQELPTEPESVFERSMASQTIGQEFRFSALGPQPSTQPSIGLNDVARRQQAQDDGRSGTSPTIHEKIADPFLYRSSHFPRRQGGLVTTEDGRHLQVKEHDPGPA